MQHFARNFMIVVALMAISLVVGMISPGMWLGNRRQDAVMLYNKMALYRNVPIAKGFTGTPFDLRIMYVKNGDGQLEAYFVNPPRNEILPIYDVEGTTQVGDVTHRFKGLGEEGRNKLKTLLESAKEGSSGAMDKFLKYFGE